MKGKLTWDVQVVSLLNTCTIPIICLYMPTSYTLYQTLTKIVLPDLS
jgi:hypothetical protein